MEKKEEQKKQQTTPRTYIISSEKLMDIMRYLMTRPYGEVATHIAMLASLAPSKPTESKDDKSKKDLS